MSPRKYVDRLATGTLQNQPCATCARDTMHQHGRCMECRAANAQAVDAIGRESRRRKVSTRMPVKA